MFCYSHNPNSTHYFFTVLSSLTHLDLSNHATNISRGIKSIMEAPAVICWWISALKLTLAAKLSIFQNDAFIHIYYSHSGNSRKYKPIVRNIITAFLSFHNVLYSTIFCMSVTMMEKKLYSSWKVTPELEFKKKEVHHKP